MPSGTRWSLLPLPVLLLLLAFPAGHPAADPAWRPLAAAVGVSSAAGTGALSLRDLAREADRQGLEAVVLADELFNRFEIGFPAPLPLLRVRPEGPSVAAYGVERWLEEVRQVNREQDGVLLVPGVRVRPHYWWSGSLLRGNRTLHGGNESLHVLGLAGARAWRGLPAADGAPTLRYAPRFLPLSLAALALAAGGTALLRSRRAPFLPGVLLLAAGLSSLAGYHPLLSSPYTAAAGDAGAGPFREVTRRAQGEGGIVSWAAPEDPGAERCVGPVLLAADPPRLQLLRLVHGYASLEAIHAGARRACLPGETWDRLLLEYCRGERAEPVWAVGSARGQPLLGGVQTVFLVRRRSEEALLEAWRKGRMYAVRQGGASPIRLEEFTLSTGDGREAVAGEKLAAVDRVTLHWAIRVADGRRERLQVQLIRSGKVLADIGVQTPAAGAQPDELPPASGWCFYRLRAWSDSCEILSNPIFVSY